MTTDPHAPTPGGPDPDERQIRQEPVTVDPVSPEVTDAGFVPPGAEFPAPVGVAPDADPSVSGVGRRGRDSAGGTTPLGADVPAVEPEPLGADVPAVEPEPVDESVPAAEPDPLGATSPAPEAEPLGGSIAAGAPEPPLDPPTFPDEAAREPGIEPGDAGPPRLAPAISFAPDPSGPSAPAGDWLDDRTDAADSPVPDPLISTSSAFTPPGTTEGDDKPDLKTQAQAHLQAAKDQLEQAKALTERPEVMVGLAFVGGALASFVLKRFGR